MPCLQSSLFFYFFLQCSLLPEIKGLPLYIPLSPISVCSRRIPLSFHLSRSAFFFSVPFEVSSSKTIEKLWHCLPWSLKHSYDRHVSSRSILGNTVCSALGISNDAWLSRSSHLPIDINALGWDGFFYRLPAASSIRRMIAFHSTHKTLTLVNRDIIKASFSVCWNGFSCWKCLHVHILTCK